MAHRPDVITICRGTRSQEQQTSAMNYPMLRQAVWPKPRWTEQCRELTVETWPQRVCSTPSDAQGVLCWQAFTA